MKDINPRNKMETTINYEKNVKFEHNKTSVSLAKTKCECKSDLKYISYTCIIYANHICDKSLFFVNENFFEMTKT